MKVIKIDESTVKEKIKIVKDFTIPEISKNLNIENFKIEDSVIKYIILHKCVYEPGLRNINKAFENLFGKLNTLIYLESATDLERKNITKDLVYENVVVTRDGTHAIIIDAGLVDKLIPKTTRPNELMMYI
jgi:ATP-dependent Lon protease